MFDWLGDVFGDDTFKTLVNGANTASSLFNAASPLLNSGANAAAAYDATRNLANQRQASQQSLDTLNSLFSPTGDYAKELRNQLERKDAAAGRRSQYGTRETQLMAQLAKERAATMQSPAYQNYLTNANRSIYGPGAAALGAATKRKQVPQIPTSTINKGAQYLQNIFGTPADASIASQLGGASAALQGAETPAALGVQDTLGSMFGTGSYLPGYESQGSGLFGNAGDFAGLLGDYTGAGAFEGAAGALSAGVGSGTLGAGSVGGADALGSLFGGTGFLPSYGATAGAGGTSGAAGGLFGSGAAGAGGAEAGAGAAGGLAYLPALPFALAIGGMLNGIFGPKDGPGYSTRENANTAASDASVYGGNENPLWKQEGTFKDWLTPDLESWMNQQPQGGGGIQGMDMDHFYYQNDNPLLAAYLKSQYGDPNQQQMSQGLGGYSEDQYGQAQGYFNWLNNDWERQYGSTQGGAG